MWGAVKVPARPGKTCFAANTQEHEAATPVLYRSMQIEAYYRERNVAAYLAEQRRAGVPGWPGSQRQAGAGWGPAG